uniref:Uncharacterized protein n=1 Tax=Aegilops tauschii subsp. strangulata TaxID=200361 RepID=A0A453PXX2_AEGTS
ELPRAPPPDQPRRRGPGRPARLSRPRPRRPPPLRPRPCGAVIQSIHQGSTNLFQRLFSAGDLPESAGVERRRGRGAWRAARVRPRL